MCTLKKVLFFVLIVLSIPMSYAATAHNNLRAIVLECSNDDTLEKFKAFLTQYGPNAFDQQPLTLTIFSFFSESVHQLTAKQRENLKQMTALTLSHDNLKLSKEHYRSLLDTLVIDKRLPHLSDEDRSQFIQALIMRGFKIIKEPIEGDYAYFFSLLAELDFSIRIDLGRGVVSSYLTTICDCTDKLKQLEFVERLRDRGLEQLLPEIRYVIAEYCIEPAIRCILDYD